VLRDESVATAIPSMTAFSHVDENLGARAKRFGWGDRRTLAAYDGAIGDRHCSLCGTCSGSCPAGVDVPAVLRSLMYREGYREEALAREAYRSLPPSRSASACSSCAGCAVRCRLGLDVASLAGRAHALLG
jgi:predicted aldo/keto reductase-like oxidoreductase